MSKPKQWKQQREMKHADVWEPLYDKPRDPLDAQWVALGFSSAYPQEAEPDGRLWVGSGDSQ